MRLKKALALALATTLTLSSSSIAAFAADPTPTPTPATSTGTTESETITGENTYLDTTKYLVTLPTSDTYGFNLDPLGVFGYFADSSNNGGTPELGSAALDNYVGKIVGTGNNSVVNMSSVDIVLECDFKLSSNISGLNIVAASTDISDDGNDIWFNVYGGIMNSGTYSAADGTVDINSDSNTDALDIELVTLSGEATGTKVLFGLPAATYTFSKVTDGYAYNMTPGTEQTAYFSLGGEMSAEGDWSQLENGGEVTLSCVYSFKGVKDVTSANALGKTGLITNAQGLDYLEEANPLSYTFTYSKATPANIVQDLKLTPATIALTNNVGTTCNVALGTQQVTLSGTTLTILSSWLSACPNGAYEITVSDNTTTKTISITVTD